MAKSKNYKILSKNELALYKKNRALKEARRDQFTNAITKALAVIRDDKQKSSERLAVKIKYFNQYNRRKKTQDMMKVVNYWMSDLSEG